uniref:BHLH domain-containing protein n=1 Tax=Musa acuminata subsp. malaccensis TaxID=214687 RepID=A0A804JUE2_MUSAM|nr:PREDICTED: transcription factor bHLH115-like isoform X1 [Musa acuminata subsp. malaccensis]
MSSNPNNDCAGWLFASDFIWDARIIDGPSASSAMLGFDVLSKEDNCPNNGSRKKRNRVESCAAPGTKACREKLRRDRLNDRFTELCSVMDPGKPPKTDKSAILSDATRLMNHLRLEAKKLKDSNEAFKDAIKSLKHALQAEKLELRDEKMRLKAEKERTEQMLKAISTTPQFMTQPAAATPHSASVAAHIKTIPHPSYMPMGMWRWIPPAALDTSQDHVLRPPVA